MINQEQIEKYVEFAREIGINDVITISNLLVSNPNESPIKLKKRSFNLYHWSWVYLKVMALRLIRTNQIEDTDHIYLLSELRRYFDAHKNLNNFVNMGKEWKESVVRVHALPLEQKIDEVTLSNIVKAYTQEEKDVSLQLIDKSDCYIELISKGSRVDEVAEMLQKNKIVTSEYMLNDNRKNTFTIDVDFIKQEIRCYTKISIEKGKAQAQTTTLIKMFEESGYTENILVNAFYVRNKSKRNNVPLSSLIEEKQVGDYYSILDKEKGEEVKYFEIKTQDLLGKDFQSVKSFIIKLESVAHRFLTQVVKYKI